MDLFVLVKTSKEGDIVSQSIPLKLHLFSRHSKKGKNSSKYWASFLHNSRTIQAYLRENLLSQVHKEELTGPTAIANTSRITSPPLSKGWLWQQGVSVTFALAP